jgi:two-component system response regulator
MYDGMNEKKILLVEDNPDEVELTLRAFKKNNITNPVVIKHNQEDVFDYLFQTSGDKGVFVNPLPAFVLLDINLTKTDGLDVLREIRHHPRTRVLPVVILTSSTEETDILNSYKNGANSYIRKPIDFNEFLKAVKFLGFYWLSLNEPIPY